jgi:hypothetical protein
LLAQPAQADRLGRAGVFVGHMICELSDMIVDFAVKQPIHTVHTPSISHFISLFYGMDHNVPIEV